MVPAVFTYIDDLEHLLQRGMAKLRRHKHVEAQPEQAVSLKKQA